MTALFIVLALEQFMQEKRHISSLSGVAITIGCLLVFGKTYYFYRRHQKGGDRA